MSVPSSAKQSAPSVATRPATTHAAMTSVGEPTACAMGADLRNTPVPIVIPTTSRDSAHKREVPAQLGHAVEHSIAHL